MFLGLVPACTIVGGGIGSTIPDYRPATVDDANSGMINVGERVAVVRASDGYEYMGRFQGADAVGIRVETDHALVTIERSDVRSMAVARGSHWLEGGAMGFAADVTVALLVGTHLARGLPDTSSVGNFHIGSDGVTVGARH